MDYNFYMHILCVIVFCSGKKSPPPLCVGPTLNVFHLR